MDHLTSSDIITIGDFVAAERWSDAVSFLITKHGMGQEEAIAAVDQAIADGAIGLPEPINANK